MCICIMYAVIITYIDLPAPCWVGEGRLNAPVSFLGLAGAAILQ